MAAGDELKKKYFSAVYELQTRDDVKDFYDEWSATYDSALVGQFGYVAHQVAAAIFRRYFPAGEGREGRVLDAGCGTGLVGEQLKKAPSYHHISGTDLSQEMLAVCKKKEIYEELFQSDLMSAEMSVCPPHSFDACICVGTFSPGHVLPRGLLQLFRAVRPGGVVCVTVHEAAWRRDNYCAAIAEFEENKKCEIIEISKHDYILGTDTACYVLVLKVLHN